MGNQETYLRMWVKKVSDSGFEGIILDSNNYGGKINHIEIPHERTRRGNGALAGEGRTILRSELGKSMRIARPGAIYDASAAAQTFSEGKWAIRRSGMEISPKMKEREIRGQKE